MFPSEQGAELEKIHNVGLGNSKTPSQTGSVQGRQVTVPLSLHAVGVNVRERPLPRPTDQCLTAFQEAQLGRCTSTLVHNFPLRVHRDTHGWPAHLHFFPHGSKEQANKRPCTNQSFRAHPSSVAMSPRRSQWGLWAVRLSQGTLKAQLP